MNSKRLLSLDAFRGFTIAAMILVNNPADWGHVFTPLLHAEWNGITPTDLIFPFFLFIVGVSIAVAYSKRLHAGDKKSNLVKKIVWRSVKIFLVGVALSYIHVLNFEDLRIVGVLQRIAIVFLICSLLYLFSSTKAQIIIGSALLLIYFIAMCFIPTPGYGKVMLEPGVNMAAWIDSFIVPGKMWQGSWDPEGFFSTIPAISTGIFGILVGQLIMSELKVETKIIWLFITGFMVTIAGLVWGWIFPINKNLWSSSYVLFTGGLASLTLAVSIYLVDVLKKTKTAQIGIIFGANAITIYVLADLLNFVFYQMMIGSYSLSNYFMQWFQSTGIMMKTGSFLYALMYIGVLFVPAYILYRKKVFIKL
ncbi:MAG: DUF5009 domain-containing protein [Bacteroidales bacterium]|nr:DUF5009 domain-containing protein [Bacteroidales bacterium]MBN2818302.1 DUF5009 domain-containing protein [Bacteroidales bacterium]